ncbi:MAG: SapC family protein [Hoeflea sp.]|uniref:SapC family protein n=1 Tax=Hoeflea sp. TaxID=1940281 RepID=UPI0032EFEFF3
MIKTKDAAGTSLPLFYHEPEAVNPERHAGKALVQSGDLGFAANAIVIPLMAAEMPAAMRSYPIVFSGPDFMPVAILGIKQGENLFVDNGGKWVEPHYVPAYVRRYPFILAGDDNAERLALCVDKARLVDIGAEEDENSKPLFDNGEKTEIIDSALSFCEQYQGMYRKTREIMNVIAGTDLLVERNSKITLGDGKSFNISGFHLVDETRLQSMEDKAFLALRKADALATIYCHLASMNSWNSLLHQASLRA